MHLRMENENGPDPRRRKLRVTTGCKTCRIRRVKCDERKPICANCGKKNRTCSYVNIVSSGQRNASSGSNQQATRNNSHTAQVSLSIVNGHFTDTSLPSPRAPSLNASIDRRSPFSQDTGRFSLRTLQDNPVSHQSPLHVSRSTTLGAILLQTEQANLSYPSVDQSYDQSNVFDTSMVDTSNRENTPHSEASTFSSEKSLVAEQIELSVEEIYIFRNYVENVSKWIGSFSQDQPFHSIVPTLALRCHVLMPSCLALSAKQLALKATGAEGCIRENVAVNYYQKAVRALSTKLMDPNYARNDGILASRIILSTYEMLDVVGKSFGSHLKGVAYFLQSRQVNGNARGIKGASYWMWYRHEIWAALQTGRCMSLGEEYWKPESIESFENLSVADIANRVIFIFGQCVSLCNDINATERVSEDEKRWAQYRKAASLEKELDGWKEKLPASSAQFLVKQSTPSNHTLPHEYPFLWFLYPQSAIAHQVYHASRIILKMKCPTTATGNHGLLSLQYSSELRQIERSREQIFLVSNAGVADSWSLISTQCLYIAGFVTYGDLERCRTLEMIESCQKSSGRRTIWLADELRNLWANQ